MAAGLTLPIVLVALSSAGLAQGRSEQLPPAAREGLDPVVRELIETSVSAVEDAPESAAAWARLCMAYEANLLWPEASRCYPRIAALEPRQAVWRLHEAVARLECGEAAAAEELLQAALEVEPDLQPARQRLAHLLVEAGDLEGALDLFLELIEERPERSEGYLGAGEVDLLAGRIDEATERLEQAVALDTRLAVAHYQLGLAYRAAGRLEEAERELRLGSGGGRRYLPSPIAAQVASLSVHLTARIERASALLGEGRNEEAAEVLEEVVERSTDNPTLLNDLAVAYLRLGRLDAARSLLDRALALEPGSFGTHLNLSSWASHSGEVEAAVAYARQAVESAPGVAATHLALARALGDRRYVDNLADSSSGRSELQAELERALEIGVDSPDAYLVLARQRWKSGDADQALEPLASALARWPDFWPGHLMRAWILVRAGRIDEGEGSLEKVRDMAPGHPDIVALERLITAARGGQEG